MHRARPSKPSSIFPRPRLWALPPLVVSALMLSTAAAIDAERGEVLSAHCVSCHGPIGMTSNPTFPHLAGQNAAYLQLQLEKFQSGVRYDPLMTPIAESLSEQDVADLATYFSSLAFGGLASAGGDT